MWHIVRGVDEEAWGKGGTGEWRAWHTWRVCGVCGTEVRQKIAHSLSPTKFVFCNQSESHPPSRYSHVTSVTIHI